MDFFEDELVRRNYDWKDVIRSVLFTGHEPLFSSIIAGRKSMIRYTLLELRLTINHTVGHPLIHLAYAFEFSSREIGMEALALTAVSYSDIHKYVDDPSYSLIEPPYKGDSLLDILNRVRSDQRFGNLFNGPGVGNIHAVFRAREKPLLEHWNAWDIAGLCRLGNDAALSQFRESQELAVALLLATARSNHHKKHFDFVLVHILTTSHAVRVLLPILPDKFQVSLLKQWWLFCLAGYIAQLRPDIDLDQIRSYELDGRDWDWAAGKAVKGAHNMDAHYVKAIRALKEVSRTWGDPDNFYLKAAVKFAYEFDGWGGFA